MVTIYIYFGKLVQIYYCVNSNIKVRVIVLPAEAYLTVSMLSVKG